MIFAGVYITQKVGKKLIIIVLLIISAVLITLIAVGQSNITVTRYHIKTDKTYSSFRFALISDLHNKEFGSDNEKLVKKIEDEIPEFIIIAGDMVLKYSDDVSVAKTLVEKLVKIAPVYYTFGNHELEFEGNCDIEKVMTDTGAVVLNNDMVKIPVQGDEIIIGGLKQYPFFEYDAPDYDNDEHRFFKKFLEAQKDNFALLVCHYPETYTWGFENYNIDLMLCGHTHGGIIRLPFLGGVFVPNQPLFSDYDKGYFDGKSADMIITSGLGNSNPLPRINNSPEICIININ